ncbi:MAG: hypothetical protein NC548_64165 [Lachnospiraceae bacterium]|nr:hypothetical protein [Lachnospiraceae bacterium]
MDPETEYWYRVRSHNVSEFTIGEKHHAYGVAAPELLPASNIAAGSYTANWTDAPKAQKYYVSNYKAEKVANDDSEYSLLLETFSACNGDPDITFMEPIGNQTGAYLDDFTDLKGWSGANNYYGFNKIGGLDYTGSYLITPEIMANPERGSMYVYVEAEGYYGDYLYIKCLKSDFGGYVAYDEEGMISGWFEFPAVEGEQIKFYSYNSLMFALSAFEVVQAVKAGDIVRRFDSKVEVPAGVGSYTFDNLDGDLYAYSAVSSFTLEGETTLSTSGSFVSVDINKGSSNASGVTEIEATGDEVRFSIDGTRVNKDYKGVVILKSNNGSVSKIIAK